MSSQKCKSSAPADTNRYDILMTTKLIYEFVKNFVSCFRLLAEKDYCLLSCPSVRPSVCDTVSQPIYLTDFDEKVHV